MRTVSLVIFASFAPVVHSTELEIFSVAGEESRIAFGNDVAVAVVAGGTVINITGATDLLLDGRSIKETMDKLKKLEGTVAALLEHTGLSPPQMPPPPAVPPPPSTPPTPPFIPPPGFPPASPPPFDPTQLCLDRTCGASLLDQGWFVHTDFGNQQPARFRDSGGTVFNGWQASLWASSGLSDICDLGQGNGGPGKDGWKGINTQCPRSNAYFRGGCGQAYCYTWRHGISPGWRATALFPDVDEVLLAYANHGATYRCGLELQDFGGTTLVSDSITEYYEGQNSIARAKVLHFKKARYAAIAPTVRFDELLRAIHLPLSPQPTNPGRSSSCLGECLSRANAVSLLPTPYTAGLIFSLRVFISDP